MKTILPIYIIAIWLLITPIFATTNFSSLPTIPEHPSKTGFNIPVAPSTQSGVRNFLVQSKQQLDSIVVAGKDKYVYLYNGNNQNTMLTYYTWNGTGWLPSIQVDLFYNESGRLMESVYYTWNPFSAQWQGAWKTLYSYNSNGQTLTEQYITYDKATQKWVNTKRYAYTFTNAGVITKSTHANWDTATNNWLVDWTTDYVYNIKNQRIADISYTIGYVPASKTEYAYNTHGVLVKKTDYFSNRFTNRWEQTAKEEYLLDGQQRPVVRTYSSWNSILQAWENLYKSNLEFDNKGNTLSVINYRWNTENIRWTIIDKQEATVDANGNVVALNYFDWNPAINNWNYRSKHNWSYNNSVSLQTLVLPHFYSNFTNSKNQVLSLQSSYNNYTNGEEFEEQKYYYSLANNNTQVVESDTDSGINIYYNPTSDYIEIISADENNILFSLYDGKGAIVFNTTLNEGSTEISLSQLPAGTYLYVLIADNIPLSGKILKK
jgi:hypothetical protein